MKGNFRLALFEHKHGQLLDNFEVNCHNMLTFHREELNLVPGVAEIIKYGE